MICPDNRGVGGSDRGDAELTVDGMATDAVLPTDESWARLTDHSGTPREQASRLISLLFPSPLAAEIDRRFGDAVAEARARLSPEALSAQEQAMLAWHRSPHAAHTGDVPATQVLHGELDAMIPPRMLSYWCPLARCPHRDVPRVWPRRDGPGAAAAVELIRAWSR